ncbi:MAG: addiction module protein [Leptospiraceae bacterium]|nr:addiction module protein [Leptospiraceae bacterium]
MQVIPIQKISNHALALDFQERAKLVDLLIASLDSKTFSKLEKSWASTATKRKKEIISGKVKTIDGKKALKLVGKKGNYLK